MVLQLPIAFLCVPLAFERCGGVDLRPDLENVPFAERLTIAQAISSARQVYGNHGIWWGSLQALQLRRACPSPILQAVKEFLAGVDWTLIPTAAMEPGGRSWAQGIYGTRSTSQQVGTHKSMDTKGRQLAFFLLPRQLDIPPLFPLG